MNTEITTDEAITQIISLLKKGYDVEEAFTKTLGEGSRGIFWQTVLQIKGLI